ncbi:LamG domain-containing protein [Fulvivirgaceae bacterium BMA12]|uniref:LamG domain-containing protein n=1 Tax=Agaribacillus aureus TaxID=3051825 RepID=A0ABT8L8V6_9BACT|nr:LamG domain-containing protein [Fulvivirgaceae bacterium BMA12]
MIKLLLGLKTFSNQKSSDWKLNMGLLSVMLIAGVIVISSCESDEPEIISAAPLKDTPKDDRLTGKEAYISHDNPRTGAPYTEEELAALSYDPGKEDQYNPGGNVSLDIVIQLEPQKIEVLIGDNQSLMVIENPTIDGNDQYVANFSTNFDDLGFGPGEDRTLSFVITYNNASDGVAASVQTLDFTFRMANVRPRALAFLKKSNGETLEIKSQVTGVAQKEDLKYGHIFTFDGTDDYLSLIDSDDLSFRYTDDYSVSIWINTTSSNSDPVIIGDKDWGSGGNPGFLFAHIGTEWKLNLGDGASRVDITGGTINDGQWHNLVATFNRDGDAVIYQDGEEVGRSDMSGIGNMNSGFPIRLAQDGTSGYGLWYEGMTSEPVIYDYVLSSGEVAGINEDKELFNVQLRKNDGTVSLLNVDHQSGTAIELDTVRQKHRIVRTFNGDPDLATINDGGDLDFRFAGDFSVAVWVNTTVSQSDPVIIGDKDWGSGGNKGFLLAQIGSNWKLNAGDGNGNRIDANGNDINDGFWHLIGVTFDRDGSAVIYQDGVALEAVDMSGLGDMTSGFPMRLAQDGTGGYGLWYEGKTSTAYVFDYALSESEMAALYGE